MGIADKRTEVTEAQHGESQADHEVAQFSEESSAANAGQGGDSAIQMQPSSEHGKTGSGVAVRRESALPSNGSIQEPLEHTISTNGASRAKTELGNTSYGGYIILGFVLLIVGFGGFGAWVALAPLKSGTMAPGVVKLAGDRKTVQHLEGGIIEEILVSEGAQVKAGQLLIRLEGTEARANLESLEAVYFTTLAQISRLKAERDGLSEFRIPEELAQRMNEPDVQELVEGERKIFEARLTNFQSRTQILEKWADQYDDQIIGLEAQRRAARRQLGHIEEELEAVQSLYDQGLYDKKRLLELKRTAAGLEGRIGEFTAKIAQSRQEIEEVKLRAIAQRDQRLEDASSELQTAQATLLQTQEKLRNARDIVKRLEIRSPRSGHVVGLMFHTPGGVIRPSTPIMDIVPDDDSLIVEARVNLVDIDVVKPGTEALVRLTAYSMRKIPPVPGQVIQVSADRLSDADQSVSYYLARVALQEEALSQLEGVHLYPGMPASVQIVTGERTALDYFLSPIEAGVSRAWLEE
jgi:HlyD family type I secretion membrane fusion protein